MYGAALLTVKSIPVNNPPPPPPPIVPPPAPPATTRYSTVAGAGAGVVSDTPPTYRLPVTLPPPATCNAPVEFDVDTVLVEIVMPVPVTTATFALPTALNVILPLAVGMFTLLFPLLILAPPPPDIPVNWLPLPMKNAPAMLPLAFIVPETLTPVPVMVIVVLPTAATVTLPFAVAI